MFTTIGLVHVHELNIRNCHEQAVNIYKSKQSSHFTFFHDIFFFLSSSNTYLLQQSRERSDFTLSMRQIEKIYKKWPKNLRKIFSRRFLGENVLNLSSWTCSPFHQLFMNMFMNLYVPWTVHVLVLLRAITVHEHPVYVFLAVNWTSISCTSRADYYSCVGPENS